MSFLCLEFLSYHSRIEASTTLAREPGIEITLTKAGSLWLVNRGATNIDLKHGELFGFNVGSFVEVNSGGHGQPPQKLK